VSTTIEDLLDLPPTPRAKDEFSLFPAGKAPLDRNVPPPPAQQRGRSRNGDWKYPLKEMLPGDSFVATLRERPNIWAYVRLAYKANPSLQFITREIEPREDGAPQIRVWRVK